MEKEYQYIRLHHTTKLGEIIKREFYRATSNISKGQLFVNWYEKEGDEGKGEWQIPLAFVVLPLLTIVPAWKRDEAASDHLGVESAEESNYIDGLMQRHGY